MVTNSSEKRKKHENIWTERGLWRVTLVLGFPMKHVGMYEIAILTLHPSHMDVYASRLVCTSTPGD